MTLPTTETSIGGLLEKQEALRTLMCIPSYLPASLCKVGITRAAARERCENQTPTKVISNSCVGGGECFRETPL